MPVDVVVAATENVTSNPAFVNLASAPMIAETTAAIATTDTSAVFASQVYFNN